MLPESQTQEVEPRAAGMSQFSTLEAMRASPPRDAAIDFTKGALVLFMVLYHWLNYFVGPRGQYYNYLRFLTPSFIFISGFMISRIHLARHENSGLRVAKRLIMRGGKLLAMVFLLNILLSIAPTSFNPQHGDLATSLRNICWMFVVANPATSPGQKNVAFSMLIPIAYLLILSAGLLVWSGREKYVFRYTLLVSIAVVASSYALGMVSSYLDLLMIGVLGIVIGFAGREQVAFILGQPYVLIVLYCCYLAVITIWDVTLPLQVISVILTTALLYVGGSRRNSGAVWRLTVLLGKYSLVGYISQIAILQAMRRIVWFTQHGVGVLLASFLISMVLTILTVEGTNLARQRSTLADGLYRLVFA